jgi:hypothetical protein
VSAGCRPPRSHEISLRNEKIDSPTQVGERLTKRSRDLRLSARPWHGWRRSKIVSHVVIREHLGRERDVAPCPNLVVEALDQTLVRFRIHRQYHPITRRAGKRLACPSVREDTPRRATTERLADLLLGVTVAGNELPAAAGTTLDVAPAMVIATA